MSIRETLSNWNSSAVVKEYAKGAVMQISTVLGHVYHIAYWSIFWSGTFRHLSDYVFGVRNFENTNLWGSFFDSKYLRFNLDFKNGVKNWQKAFCFSDNWIRIGVVKFSLWRTRSFSSAANVLTSSPKILHVNKRHFFQLNWLGGDHWIWKRWYHADMNGAWARLPCSLSNGLLKREFLDIYFHTFSESGTSKIQGMRVNLFFKTFKISAGLHKSSKKLRKIFLFLR